MNFFQKNKKTASKANDEIRHQHLPVSGKTATSRISHPLNSQNFIDNYDMMSFLMQSDLHVSNGMIFEDQAIKLKLN